MSSCAKTPRPPIISIHALREEGDLSLSGSASTDARFLSTPSARRATASYRHFLPPVQISIHALREEGDAVLHHTVFIALISIHALREEGDLLVLVGIKHVDKFLSTPSARRATRPRRRPCRLHPNFYPRPPRGGRPRPDYQMRQTMEFLSTPSARRATRRDRNRRCRHKHFYPRPPRGGRPWQAIACGWKNQFLSTPSARRATSTR